MEFCKNLLIDSKCHSQHILLQWNVNQKIIHSYSFSPFSEGLKYKGFFGIFFFFDIALHFKPTLNAWKNLTATVAILNALDEPEDCWCA